MGSTPQIVVWAALRIAKAAFSRTWLGNLIRQSKKGGHHERIRKEVERQAELKRKKLSGLDNFTPEEAETIENGFYNIIRRDGKDKEHQEKEEERKKESIRCANLISSPSKQSITNIMVSWIHIIFRLATDEMGNVIKEPWSPHGSNPDGRLDSLVFGVRNAPPDRY